MTETIAFPAITSPELAGRMAESLAAWLAACDEDGCPVRLARERSSAGASSLSSSPVTAGMRVVAVG